MTGSVNRFIFTVKILLCVVSGASALFFCRLGMPPKRSNPLRNLFAGEVAIAAGGEPRERNPGVQLCSRAANPCLPRFNLRG